MSETVNDGSTPPYLKDYQGPSGKEGVGPEDATWIGEDGELDPSALLHELGYDPDPPLVLILLAIIDAHSSVESSDRQDRLEQALKALTGVKRKPGMDNKDDYDLLLEVAWRYWRQWCQTRSSPEVAPIVREVIDSLPEADPRKRHAAPASTVRRLSDKFKENRDVLLARVTSEQEWERLDIVRAINEIIERMAGLKIPVVRRSAKPRWRQTEE